MTSTYSEPPYDPDETEEEEKDKDRNDKPDEV